MTVVHNASCVISPITNTFNITGYSISPVISLTYSSLARLSAPMILLDWNRHEDYLRR